jgi:metallophosphoesterase (TIGR03767 family)
MADAQDSAGPSRPGLTTEHTVRRLPAEGGYHRLGLAAGERHLRRSELGDGGDSAGGGADAGQSAVVLRLVQVSDFQLADLTSPTRLEFLQRLAGDPTWAQMVPSYRPQEFTAVAQVEAIARTVRELARAGRPADLVVTTGDNTDNQQVNELEQFTALMDGGSSTRSIPEGVQPGTGARGAADPAYYHPDAAVEDRWKSELGFPAYREALRQAAAEFTTTGFGVPWVAAFGNHDALVQGRAPGTPEVAALLQGLEKPVLLDEETRAATPHAGEPAMELYQHDPARFSRGPAAPIEADAGRRLFGRAEFLAATRGTGGTGGTDGAGDAVAYFAEQPHPAVRLLVLDTVNPGGHVDGSIGAVQLGWLREQLAAAQAADQLVVLASHHGLSTMTNGYIAHDEAGRVRPGQDLPRALGPEIEDLLLAHPNVALWLSGHTHRNRVGAVGAGDTGDAGGRGFWQISSSAMIDWPCQARMIEIAVEGEQVLLRCTMLDHLAHAAPEDEDEDGYGDTNPLLRVASVGRELAANILDGVGGELAEGTREDRNVELLVPVSERVRIALLKQLAG